MKGPVLHPEGCIDASQVTTTSAPNSPIAKAEARIEGEKVKGWVNSVVLALSIGVNIVLFVMYLESQRAVADAYKDIKTQVWVKQDKEEEKFQKFVAGPYAELAGKVEASQILFSKCKEAK
jgi:hypothetical protein